jgi:hypothetical protein
MKRRLTQMVLCMPDCCHLIYIQNRASKEAQQKSAVFNQSWRKLDQANAEVLACGARCRRALTWCGEGLKVLHPGAKSVWRHERDIC